MSRRLQRHGAHGAADLQKQAGLRPVPHWAQIGERTFVAGAWLLYQVHRVLGRFPFLLCLYPVVAYYWLTHTAARHASLQYLQRMHAVYGLWRRPPGRKESLQHFLAFAHVILDKMLAMTGRYRASQVRLQGLEPLLADIRKGQGAIMVTAHMGCIELCQAMARNEPGLRLNILVHTRHAERFNRMMQKMAPDGHVQLLQVTDFGGATAMLLADKVARGECIAIAGDRVPLRASKTTQAQFLQHEAPFPVGPYVLAALLKCPLYFMGCVHEAGGQGYVIDFRLLAANVVLPRPHRDQALAQYAAAFSAQVERLLALSPFDWFNFFPFWDQAEAVQPGAAQSLTKSTTP